MPTRLTKLSPAAPSPLETTGLPRLSNFKAARDVISALVGTLPDAGVVICDGAFRLVFADGLVPLEDPAAIAPGCPLAELFGPDTWAALSPRYEAARGGEPQYFRFRAAGERAGSVSLTPLADERHARPAVLAVFQRAAADDAGDPVVSERRLADVERLVGVGAFELDLATGRLDMSPGACRLLGLSVDDSVDLEEALAIVHQDDRERARAALTESVEHHRPHRGEYRVVLADGKARQLLVHSDVDLAAGGRPVRLCGALRDVTLERQETHRRIELEGLFSQGFDRAPLAMSVIRPSDGRYLRVNEAFCTLLGRTANELLELTHVDVAHPDDRAADLAGRQKVAAGHDEVFQSEKRYMHADGHAIRTILSATPVRGLNGEVTAIFSQIVDISAQKAREAELERAASDARWLRRIRAAIDDDRLVLFAQPIIDLSSGAAVQQELLVRIRERDGTILPPGDFLPAAERYGLITEIDRCVVRKAVEHAARGVAVEVNLGAASVADPEMIHVIERALADTGANPSLVAFEVTETAIMDDVDAGRTFAERLAELGCGFALDDFGTGFATLAYLKHLPAQYLKIDIEFVRELLEDEANERVVRGIVGLAHDFDQKTVAEGVEDEATLQRLRELGVDYAQGFHLGRPAPFEDQHESCR